MSYDSSVGIVTFEVEMMLSSDSGRSKHTDIEGQGYYLMIPIKNALTALPLSGLAFGNLRYMGAQRSGLAPLEESSVGSYRGSPEDERGSLVQEQGRIRIPPEGLARSDLQILEGVAELRGQRLRFVGRDSDGCYELEAIP